ncbi:MULTISPECIES: hypothetical protein [unclassified Methylobacterium]|uniref:hypothetical protein n=1 Tax=unclassified Methylobacterium TaxID=2615210 RepID=UPI0011C1F618|nr:MULTISPECIES: hypothetical protein [unclassified Methylobacterium]QEE38776.1 hypothetical protein FVA80_07160 [Methylobacterium sp. WL1]TXN57400.1 hypothetical protein FV241_11350 [Methylobacterium sp. WL2]
MSKAAPLASPEARIRKKGKRTAYLIAVYQKRQPVRVYAVMDVSAALAVAQVTAFATDAIKVEIVGSLSRNLARQFGLAPGQIRLV